MRYAIWSAVSRKEQAGPDKVTLKDHENKCRAAAQAKAWQETAGPYIVPGATRSFYVNLTEAETDIPQLKQMLDDARNDLFDVLVLFSYDRLGDLVDMIAQSLRFYGKQLYSVTQAVEPQDPARFDPYADEGEAIMRDAARITQRFRINDLRRKYRAGVPARVDKGLNPLRVPFGYRWVGKKEPPVLDSTQAALLVEMKDLYLAGRTIYEITRYATASGIKPPTPNWKKPKPDPRQWEPTSVRYMLANPFYAGLVVINKSTRVRDVRRKNKSRPIAQPRTQWKMGKGLHKPLWDEATHHAILREMERRKESTQNYAARYPYSGLLYCGVCGQKLHRHMWGSKGKTIVDGKTKYGRRRVLVCETGSAHVILNYDEGITLVSNELARQLNESRKAPAPAPAAAALLPAESTNEKLIEDLRRKRKQIQDDREAGIYDQAEAAERIASINGQITRLEQKTEAAKETVRVQEEFKELIGDKLEYFAEWVIDDDPKIVHRLIHALCARIKLYPGNRVEIEWRTGIEP